MRVLLVDDDRLVRVTLAAGLQRHGHRVSDAESAEEALELLENAQFDVVVSDIEMPGMGGIGFARVLQRDYTATRRMALTASQLTAAEDAAMRHSFESVLLKPISAQALSERLSELGKR